MSRAARPAPVKPLTAEPTAVIAPGSAPPMATLCAPAKRLPAATLPMPACRPAAIEPINSSFNGPSSTKPTRPTLVPAPATPIAMAVSTRCDQR
ncbi:hypothetical protein BGW80DRAFT_1292416 [Lactifluus volemus]|nr:hypothetical protein BGW80DRAFT_1292416 [Lactifluus volemus]